MYKEYLAEFWYSAKALENSKVSFFVPTGGIYGEVGVNTFKNAIGSHYIPRSSEYVAPSSIDIVRPWFETIGYGESVLAKGTLKKSLFPPRWSLANGINIDYANIFWEDIIIKMNKRHKEKGVPYTRFLSLLMRHKMKEGYGDSKVTPYPTQLSQCSEATKGGSSKAPTGSKTGHLKRKKESSLAMDSNPIQTSASTLVVAEMHKDDHQATGGPTSSFIIHSESTLGNDASAVFTAEADPGKSAPNDFIPQQQDLVSRAYVIENKVKTLTITTFLFPSKKVLRAAISPGMVDPDLLTKDIMGCKTYDDYKNDWIYEWNKDVPWVDEKPWTDTGEDNGNKELCEIHEPPVCNIRKYMMIKYSFNDDEEYVAVNEDEYDDLIMTRRDACQAYQEIFRIMDEGWMVTRAT
ncbi:hypothetical protein Tco_0857307 [Tanacetum coccineum]|uniref:Uncharacterized protein n=1 Tax=Tanacetum coccineum TaxID=301880 RepID=A0ABQ5B615_9ASTR